MTPLLRGIAAIVLPAALSAQRVTTSVDVGGAAMRYADTISSAGPSISPAISAEWTRASLGASGTVSRFGSGSSVQLSGAGSTFTPSRGWLAGELAGSAGGSAHSDGARTGQTMLVARAHAMSPVRGGWLGGGVGGSWDGALWRRILSGEAGLWASSDGVTLVSTVAPTKVDDTISYTDVQGAAHWERPSYEFAISVGARAGAIMPGVGGTSRTWGSVSGTSWVTRTIGLVASAGTYPVDLTQGFPGGRFIAVSVRFAAGRRVPAAVEPTPSPAPKPAVVSSNPGSGMSDFRITGSGDSRTIRLRAPGAKRVEINGDFTGWQPVALALGSDGLWRVSLRIPRGKHEMNVRVDGGRWTVPPGLTSIADEFGGSVGLLVIP